MRQWLAVALVTGMGAVTWGQSSPLPQSTGQNLKGSGTFAVLRSEWARNLHDKRVEDSVAQYAPDADFLDPSGARIHGTTGLRELFQTITATYDSDIKFTSHRSEVTSTLAYDSGTYQEILIVRAGSRVEHSSGSYLTIYVRGKGGEWLIVQQMWTGAISDAPETAGAVVSPLPVPTGRPANAEGDQKQISSDFAQDRLSTPVK
jgi:ketosteroid isomerase-like protein